MIYAHDGYIRDANFLGVCHNNVPVLGISKMPPVYWCQLSMLSPQQTATATGC